MAATILSATAEHGDHEAALRRRNEELEREERTKEELMRAWRRLSAAEEAEERLCFQLGEAEAEAANQARENRARIVELMERLSIAYALLLESSFPTAISQ